MPMQVVNYGSGIDKVSVEALEHGNISIYFYSDEERSYVRQFLTVEMALELQNQLVEALQLKTR